MQIQVETVYSLPVLTAMARALRKTLRRKKSRRTRIFSVVLMLIALLTIVLSLTTDPSFPAIISMAVLTLALLAVMIWEDQLNGYWARRQILAGTEVAQTTFTEDGYTTTTRAAKRNGVMSRSSVFARHQTISFYCWMPTTPRFLTSTGFWQATQSSSRRCSCKRPARTSPLSKKHAASEMGSRVFFTLKFQESRNSPPPGPPG